MRRIIHILIPLIICVPVFAQQGVQQVVVHIDQTDGCPEWTRITGPHTCRAGGGSTGKLQADAVCASSGGQIKWKATGNVGFTLAQKPPGTLFNSCTPAANILAKDHLCTITQPADEYHYNIETNTCVLDPRIILN
jgi:hypothetical protein